METSLNEITIGVVGLGLIGGSLALRLSSSGAKIIGIVRDVKDFPENNFEKISADLTDLHTCDFVFLCVPLNKIISSLEAIQPHLKPGAIVTDVGSVKAFICNSAAEIMREDCIFVGGHPMAGTEKSGFANAFPELFENRSWALMNEINTSSQVLSSSVSFKEGRDTLEKIIQCTGAKIIKTSPKEHDQAVSLISHLPLFLSISLLNTVNKHENQKVRDLALSLASSGFESMTRLAKGNPVLNEDLLNLNSAQVLASYESFLDEAEHLLRSVRD